MEADMFPASGTSALFAGLEVWEVPSLADRYKYKKEAGSSDTTHQQDVLKT